MGTKYSSISVSGYNATPPADDGSQVTSNQVKWSYIKTKIGDPLNTFASSINSALTTALNFGVRQVTASGNTTAADHMKTVEIAPSVSTAVTISLGDAATMAANYIVRIKNSGSSTVTVSRVTGADTLDGVAQDITLFSGQSATFETTTGADGYLSTAMWHGGTQLRVTNTASADRIVTVTGGVSGSSGHATLDVSGGYLRLSAGTNDIMWGTADVSAGGGATATLTTIGGSGPGTAGQTAWLRVRNASGTAYFIPVWQ